MIPYKIEGERCGRDKNGDFNCKCGKCVPLCDNERCDCGDSSDNSRNS